MIVAVSPVLVVPSDTLTSVRFGENFAFLVVSIGFVGPMPYYRVTMETPRNLFLVGLMGAGKTSIGRQLARQLGLRFVDSDHEIERRTGADIPWIFDLEGEAGFRRRERDVIADLCAGDGIVLATGGGAVIDPDNRACLRRNGTVVYLCASIDRLAQRVSRSNHRPLLEGQDPRARLEALFRERDPLYREIADLVVHTDRQSVAATARAIVRQLSTLEREAAAP